MKIQKQDIYHGIALKKIVEFHSFKALNKLDNVYGHYSINNDKRMFLKFRTTNKSPWQFTFKKNDLEAIENDYEANMNVLLCLVCGLSTICPITYKQIRQLIDLKSKKQQRISVEVRESGSMWLKGSVGKLKHSIPHNSFPKIIFENKKDKSS